MINSKYEVSHDRIYIAGDLSGRTYQDLARFTSWAEAQNFAAADGLIISHPAGIGDYRQENSIITQKH